MENTMVKMTNVRALNYVLENYADVLPAEVVEKIEAVKTSYEKKALSVKKNPNAEENNKFAELIISFLIENAGKGYCATEIAQNVDGLTAFSTSRITSILHVLTDANRAVYTKEGRKGIYKAIV